MPLTKNALQQRLNKASPADKNAKTGDVLNDLITQHNALCAKLDAANLAGMGTNNVATLGVKTLGSRPQ